MKDGKLLEINNARIDAFNLLQRCYHTHSRGKMKCAMPTQGEIMAVMVKLADAGDTIQDIINKGVDNV